MVDVSAVEIIKKRVVRLEFSDESSRVGDLAPFLWGPGFEDIASDDELFAQVRVDPDLGTICWPDGADLDPDVLHGDFVPVDPTPSTRRHR